MLNVTNKLQSYAAHECVKMHQVCTPQDRKRNWFQNIQLLLENQNWWLNTTLKINLTFQRNIFGQETLMFSSNPSKTLHSNI
jgi:hypothetical protein